MKTGLRALLTHPKIYDFFQAVMGADRARQAFVRDRIKPTPGMKILDVGCGTAEILNYMEGVHYWGYDTEPGYIESAAERFKEKGKFFYKEFTNSAREGLPQMDLVLLVGVLHHMDDGSAKQLLRGLSESLVPGGRLLSVDPCFSENQNPLARFLISKDRGQNVRNKEGYEGLFQGVFRNFKSEVKHQTWIPYTHCHMLAIKD